MTCPKASGWGSGFRVYLDPPNYPLEIPQVPTIKGQKGSIRGCFGGVLVGRLVQGVRGFSLGLLSFLVLQGWVIIVELPKHAGPSVFSGIKQ